MLPRGQLRLDGPGFDDVFDDPDRDTWVTPKWMSDAIGRWDLDPCANERSHIVADRTFRLDRGQDGLVLARFVSRSTRTWINPPYSRGQVIQWVEAYQHARFCFLVRLDFSTAWIEKLIAYSSLLLVPRQRVNFEPPPGVRAGSNAFPHGLFFKHADDATADIRALCYRWTP